MKNMSKTVGFLLIIILLIIGFLVFSKPEETEKVPSNTYTSETYNISFEYPDNYILSENYINDEFAPHNSVTLYESSTLPLPTDSEGPPAITFNIYANNSNLEVEEWIRQNRASNFSLGDQRLYPITIDSEPALVYNWDGLYRGKSIVFKSQENIVMASVAYNADTDTIRKDFEGIIFSVKLGGSSN